MSILEKGLV